MKISFDTGKITIPLDVFMQMLSYHVYSPIGKKTLEKGAKLGMLEYTGSLANPLSVSITSQGVDYVDKILTIGISDDEFIELAVELRELFPKGRKPGTNLNWRDSIYAIVQKLKSLKKRCEEVGTSFTSEQAIDATKRYINSFNGDYTYMQVLKYFILKKDLAKGEEKSQLLSFIENEDATTDNTSWMDSVR